jgi:hypothetical protein
MIQDLDGSQRMFRIGAVMTDVPAINQQTYMKWSLATFIRFGGNQSKTTIKLVA